MSFKKIRRSCGHEEKVWLVDGEENNPGSIRAHEYYKCYKCQKRIGLGWRSGWTTSLIRLSFQIVEQNQIHITKTLKRL